MKNRLFLAAAASGVALAAVVGVALGVGHDEPRLVRTAGVSAPLEETSTTSAPAAETQKVAELDAIVENHEQRINALESTTTTAPAQPVPTVPAAPAVEAEPSTTSTSIAPTTTTTQAAPTTTTTFRGPPWWCPVEAGRGQTMVPCDSTTTTSPAS